MRRKDQEGDQPEFEQQEDIKPKESLKDDYIIDEIFKGSKFAGVKMTHIPTGINIFRELRRGQFIPDREMKAELKKLIPK